MGVRMAAMFHPCFRLSTLLWLTFGAACFFAGMSWQRQIGTPSYWSRRLPSVPYDAERQLRIESDLAGLSVAFGAHGDVSGGTLR